MEKFDFKKRFKPLYTGNAGRCVVIDVPEINYLSIDGAGDPAGPDFQAGVQALYAISYTVKFARKAAGAKDDYAVAPLEALWWSDTPGPLCDIPKTDWRWTLLIAQPPQVTPEDIGNTVSGLLEKKKIHADPLVRLAGLREGLAAQVLHVGPYDQVVPTISALMAFIADQPGTPRGKHHEIYLSDPRRTSPEKLKTLMRQPFTKTRP